MTGSETKMPEACLEEFCSNFAACDGQLPAWSSEWDGDWCRVFVELHILEVPHKFAGAYFRAQDEAKADTAKRALWYLQVPGFENAYEPDPKARAVIGKDIPSPPANWVSPAEEGGSMQAAQRKTTLMRVQNRLQQIFGRHLKSGQSVWQWSYEMDSSDTEWPPLCKAKVHIAAADQSFEGNWARGQREAQLEACKLVSAFLDLESPSMSGMETPSAISPSGQSRSFTSASTSSLETLDDAVIGLKTQGDMRA